MVTFVGIFTVLDLYIACFGNILNTVILTNCTFVRQLFEQNKRVITV
jgi:hypothetical protein